jgi:hypothetical protein
MMIMAMRKVSKQEIPTIVIDVLYAFNTSKHRASSAKNKI